MAGFLYWVVFLLVLEPGNILRAYQAGRDLSLVSEVVRIVAASGLGAIATPTTLWTSRHFLTGRTLRRSICLLGAMAALSGLLILTSCLLAAWVYEQRLLPTTSDITSVMVGNGLLVWFALLAQCGLDQVIAKPSGRSSPLLPTRRHVAVKTRSGQVIISIENIDWIESQGNYLALHVGVSVHLVRETMAAFYSRLDAARFLRVHRSVIVAVDRIASIEFYENGDSLLTLHGGTQVKSSRTYRKALRAHWQ